MNQAEDGWSYFLEAAQAVFPSKISANDGLGDRKRHLAVITPNCSYFMDGIFKASKERRARSEGVERGPLLSEE